MTLLYGHDMRRNDVVQVRVSAEEKLEMESRASAAGLKLSEWLRRRALEKEPVVGLSRTASVPSRASVSASGSDARPSKKSEGSYEIPKIAPRRWAQ